tara:strand:+ start:719 stop:1918 length:1200 start_codon:yes stop_codon:yes gene_type:complete
VKNPLFLCGPANCGTNLVKAILGVNNKIHLESEPFLPIFQFLRTSIVKKNFKKNKSLKFDEPLFEYYFSNEKINQMSKIQKSNLRIKFEKKNISMLKKKIQNRMKDYVPHLKKNINDLKGGNFKEIFDNALKIIDKNHKKKNIKWVGWMDSWIEEFFPILAKEYKHSKFILIIRDPRASIASYRSGFKINVREKNMEPLTLSYLRSWRKQVAFSEYYKNHKSLKKRILEIKYEDLVKKPKIVTKKMCKFLEIKFSPEMLDTTNFMGLGTNTKKWKPNSNYKATPQTGIYKNSLYKWKKKLPNDLKNFIEFVVGPELKYFKYNKIYKNKYTKLEYKNIIRFHSDEHKKSKGWRTNNNKPEVDIHYEVIRNKLIKEKKINEKTTKEYFLFDEIYQKLKKII